MEQEFIVLSIHISKFLEQYLVLKRYSAIYDFVNPKDEEKSKCAEVPEMCGNYLERKLGD